MLKEVEGDAGYLSRMAERLGRLRRLVNDPLLDDAGRVFLRGEIAMLEGLLGDG